VPLVAVNGIRLAYERTGTGEPVLMIMGSGAAARVWSLHQTPALHRSGYQAVTFDNRGMPPSEAPPGRYALTDLVADTAGLIEALDLAPCRIVATSMGAMIAQELAIARPELVRCAALIATRGRADVVRRAMARADQALAESDLRLPQICSAVNEIVQMLSPATLRDDDAAAAWIDIFELAGGQVAASGQAWATLETDRRPALRRVAAPCRVIGFADDLVTPPHLGLEVAEAIPNCDFVEIEACGHLGFLERPDEVNAAIIEFLDKF